MKTLLTIFILSVLSIFHLFADDILLRNGRTIKNCTVLDTVEAKVRYKTILGVGTVPLKNVSSVVISPFNPLLKTTIEEGSSPAQEKEKEKPFNSHIRTYYYGSIGSLRDVYGSNFDGSKVGMEWNDDFGADQPFYIPKIDPGSGTAIRFGYINRDVYTGIEFFYQSSNSSASIPNADPELERNYAKSGSYKPEASYTGYGFRWLINVPLIESPFKSIMFGGIDFVPYFGYTIQQLELKNIAVDHMTVYTSGPGWSRTKEYSWSNRDESLSNTSIVMGAYLNFFLTSFLQFNISGEFPIWEFRIININTPKIINADGSKNDLVIFRHKALSFGITIFLAPE